MNPDKRLLLLRSCYHDITVDDPRSPTVDIYYAGLIITVDFCIKHGTGSGKIIAVKLAKETDNMPPAATAAFDNIIALWAGNVRREVSADLQAIDSALKALREEDNANASTATDSSN